MGNNGGRLELHPQLVNISDDERRFIEHMIGQAIHEANWEERRQRIPNAEAYVLFQCVQLAFGGRARGRPVTVDSYLLDNLAALGWVIMEDRGEPESGVYTLGRDCVFQRALRGFMSTLRGALEDGQAEKRDGGIFIGSFQIPDWMT